AQCELIRLDQALEEKAAEFDRVIKMGRTQMQDAVPIRLGQEFSAYASSVRRSIERFDEVSKELCQVNLGGTAIGTGVNANIHYMEKVVPNTALLTGLPLIAAADRIDGTQNMDCFVRVSGVVKACAVSLSKMSNDLRLLSSGPRTGFGEISLPPRQNGSSIMPGKVNPVIPEVVSQVAFAIVGNDVTITMAAEAGQLELNAFGPVLFDRLFDSIESLTGAVSTLIHHCILGITAHPGRCRRLVERSVGIITVICPYVGYDTAARIAKEALKTGCPIRQLLLEKGCLLPSSWIAFWT
ncbi:aspartate ammonia-lyase, partial [gut metagenome]